MVKSARAKRMAKHHRRHKKNVGLNLVSLMDIFTILVFFLLVNSSDVETLPNTKDLELPESIAEEKAKETVVILIGKEDILVQGTPVASIDDTRVSRDSVLLLRRRPHPTSRRESGSVDRLTCHEKTGEFRHASSVPRPSNGRRELIGLAPIASIARADTPPQQLE